MVRSLSLIMLGSVLGAGVAAGQMHDGSGRTEFTVRIQNISTNSTLKLSNGQTAPAPTAPVLWLVHSNRNPIFVDGSADRGVGLESLAEDGDPGRLAMSLKSVRGVVNVGTVAIPEGDMEPGPILPGKMYVARFVAEPGQQLTLAMMFGQSNDWFYAPVGNGISLFDENEYPITGDITAQLVLWDAGTEVDEEPGLGPNQAPRQMNPNTGPAENGVVRRVSGRFRPPTVTEVIRVTLTAARSTHD